MTPPSPSHAKPPAHHFGFELRHELGIIYQPHLKAKRYVSYSPKLQRACSCLDSPLTWFSQQLAKMRAKWRKKRVRRLKRKRRKTRARRYAFIIEVLSMATTLIFQQQVNYSHHLTATAGLATQHQARHATHSSCALKEGNVTRQCSHSKTHRRYRGRQGRLAQAEDRGSEQSLPSDMQHSNTGRLAHSCL